MNQTIWSNPGAPKFNHESVELWKKENDDLRNENAALIQRYGELQEAARKVIRYWGIRHESYLKEYVKHMDAVIQRHILEDK
jgi:hypothetical protein